MATKSYKPQKQIFLDISFFPLGIKILKLSPAAVILLVLLHTQSNQIHLIICMHFHCIQGSR